MERAWGSQSGSAGGGVRLAHSTIVRSLELTLVNGAFHSGAGSDAILRPCLIGGEEPHHGPGHRGFRPRDPGDE